jgi:hypothetical protein
VFDRRVETSKLSMAAFSDSILSQKKTRNSYYMTSENALDHTGTLVNASSSIVTRVCRDPSKQE